MLLTLRGLWQRKDALVELVVAVVGKQSTGSLVLTSLKRMSLTGPFCQSAAIRLAIMPNVAATSVNACCRDS